MSRHSVRVPLPDSPVTVEMIDKGLILKNSFTLTGTMCETWVAVLIAKATYNHISLLEERM
jgi:hypothetical protein